ncbi:Permease of the drug/metabolite transporter (DMT) superfamily [Modicisalibacter muralis]|uniref:Permease of the drug/metabolite transporter (DMT) superfamily n=1 Tax=Modicisalibacter muralis TaxID=119000 RepID=A0A1G9HVC8_9GAMM|nr:DMT family transporter [Halomonas muralis]SDL16812.1 Permease of the drug/metabolite transporter (DMT) superfamily [Halomonas muralis]
MNGSRTSTPCVDSVLSCTHARRSIDMSASVLMTLFCLILGFQQVAIKAVAADISPLAQVGMRSLVAALLVALLACWRGIGITTFRTHLGPGLLIGLGFTAEFAFVALGLNYTLASHMSVFLYTAPVFAALGLHFLVLGEQLIRRQWMGVVMAFAGMLIAMAPTASGVEARALMLGDALGLLAGLSWASTTLVLRRSKLSEAPPEQTLCYQLSVAALLLLPAAILLGDVEEIDVTGLALASLTFQTLVISFGALLLWFSLLRRYWASQLGVFSFLSPIFGVLFGAVLLNEPLTVNFVIGGGVILGGIVLVSR